MDTACQFSSLGVRCGNCAKCNLAMAIAERDAYRAALEELVLAASVCRFIDCEAPATFIGNEAGMVCDEHAKRFQEHELIGLNEASALRAAIALLAAHEGKVK